MKTRKLGIMLTASVLIMALAFAGAVSADASGTCGDNLQWTFSDSTKTLTITGSGVMNDYGEDGMPWADNRSSITSVKLPDGLKNIGNRAFDYCTALKSIEIPANVETLGDMAFWYCEALETVTFAEGSKLKTIGDTAFSNCDVLTSIEIPANVETIGEYTFYDCDTLPTVTFAEGSKLKTIGKYAFCDCYALKSIAIPKSVETIGENAFYQNLESALTTVTFAEGSKLKTIGDNAFYACGKLKSIEIPANVETIGMMAFCWTGLTSIEIPASVETIGEQAFSNCYGLTTVTFADVSKLTTIGIGAFGNTALKKVILKGTVSDEVEFGEDLFVGCSNFNVVISDKLQTPAVMSYFVEPSGGVKPVWYISEKQTASLPESYGEYYICFLNGGKLVSSFTQDEKKLPTADDVILRDGYVLEGWYDDVTLKTKHSDDSIAPGSPVYAKYKVYTAEKTTDATGTATFGGKNVLALQQDQSAVSKGVLESVSGLGSGKTVTFVADNTKIGEIPELSRYTKIEDVSIFEINVEDKVSGVATFEVTVTFASPEDAAAYGDKVRFVHYVAGAWQTYPLESTAISKDGASIRYKVTTTSFSPFGISIQSINPARGHSASLPKDYTPSSSVPPMVQETAKPTTAPTLAAPTAMPTTKPTTQATTSKSPAPFVGLVAGLGAAALVLTRMRR